MTTIHLSKLDVSKRELEHAIRLFFLSGDPVVIHLIISSSQQMLRDLCHHEGIETFMDKAIEMVKAEYKKEVKEKLVSAYNFFHHADRDPKGIKEFNPESSEYALWESVEMYYALTKEVTGIMQAYRFWFYTKNANVLEKQEDKAMFTDISTKINYHNKASYLEIAAYLENKRTR